MIDLILYNDRTAFAPSVLSGGAVQVGGFEVACEQIASGVAAIGASVEVFHNGGAGYERGVVYQTPRRVHPDISCRALLTARACHIPSWIKAERTFTTVVDDPRSEPESFAHLRGKSTLIALSEWQAGLYRALGHERVIVIPSMIADDVYNYRSCEKKPGRFVCVNAWNKGTDATLRLWSKLKRIMPGCTLSVGSPYSHPPDAMERCAFSGARWLGTLTPAGVVDALSTAEAVFRVCERPETFGVADAIAEVVGARVHCLCTNGFGAARDVLSSSYLTTDLKIFLDGVLEARDTPGLAVPRGDYFVSSVIKQWERTLFG